MNNFLPETNDRCLQWTSSLEYIFPKSKIGKFWRIVTTQKLDKSTSTSNLIGKSDNFPIGAVHIQFGKDDLEFTYREIRYMDHTFSKLMDYNGKIVVPNNKQPETLKSGTEPISNSKYEEILFSQNIGVERIKYRVNYYKSTINENGACLELGSKWQKKIEQPLTIICHQDPTLTNKYRQFNTRIVLREVSNGEYHNIIFGNYFGNLKREVWTCTDEKQQNKRIWRVVNQFKVKPGKMNAIKELYYYDGLSITLGKIGVKASLEIIEVKYLDPSNLNVLSYGEVQLSGEAASNSITISPSTLEYPVKRDFHYTLGKNELRKKVLDSEGVIILEIGQKVDEHVKNNHEGLFCEHHESDGKTSMLMRPIIVIYKLDGDGFLPVKMDERMFSDYFELVPRVWKCKGGIQDIYRVKNLLKKKCQTPVKTQSNKIAQVYYRDGITISKDEDIVTVEEIKYVSDLTENYKLLKFDGFMTFKDSARTIGIEATTPLPVRDMHNYLLDSEIVDVAGPYGCRLDDCPLTSKGAIFEIVSHRKKEIEVTHNFVTCEREEDAKYKKEFGMKVYGYLKTKADTEWSRQVVDIRNSEDFEGIAQETWTCKRDGKQIFYKVKNYMVVVGELARLYYSDGISVNWLVLPDGSKNVEIEEVKLVDSDTFETLKYDGELRFVSKAGQRIMQKFFPFDCEGQSLTAGREAENYWSLNAIRVLASRKRTVSNIEQKKGSLFEKKSLPFNMRFVPGTWRGTRVVRVGTKWEDEYNPTTIPKCMLYDGNKEYRSEYIPKIVEYYDDKWYEFDEDTFHFYFDLKQQDLWFCVTDEEVIFRIVSTFELLPKPIVGDIKLLALHEGVNLEPIHWRSRRRTNLSETVFINPINNKHLKYVGELRHIVDATKLEPSKNAPKTAIAGWYAKEYLDDLKRKTTGKFKSLRQALLLD